MSDKHFRALQKRIHAIQQRPQQSKQAGVSRRQFLSMASASISALAFGRAVPPIHPQHAKTIIVIGAGASGLAAARLLHDAGHTVIVLEARDRIGGRVWTDMRLSNIPVDLGASWIHGIDDNPVWELAQAYGIRTAPTDYDDLITYTADGDTFSDDEVAAWEAFFDDLLTQVEAIRQTAGRDLSLREAIEMGLANLEWDADERHILEAMLISGIENEYANRVERLSAYHWDEADEFDGDDVVFPNGYEELFRQFADGLDIRLNQMVTAIDYSSRGALVTTTTNQYTADKVVITVPLGVLKRNAIVFSPPLPPVKQRAIERLDMGVLNKVYLLFREVVWEADAQFFFIADARAGFVEWVNLYPITGKPLLLAFYSARHQAQFEAVSEADVIRRTLDALGGLFDGVHEAFVQAIATRWGDDPFAYGSYSSYGVGSSPDDRLALGEPIDGVLYFAGEATRIDHPATVHGAVMSGYAVASAILET